MRTKKRAPRSTTDDQQPSLGMDLPLNTGVEEKAYKRAQYPIWTENKARLIQRYLLYFVYVTRHGTYIDGFAGPQQHDKPEAWAANLVTGIRLLRNFYLCEITLKGYRALQRLKKQRLAESTKSLPRIETYRGDINGLIPKVLSDAAIDENEATFALLDQRTFECHWTTAETIARHKAGPRKIEIFYFLATGWVHRSISGLRNRTKLQLWWGRADYEDVRKMSQDRVRDEMMSRFRKELGYAFVQAYPIFERSSGGRIMYYMIHASDHPLAEELMRRAYRNALKRAESPEQIQMFVSEAQAKQ